MSYEDVVGCDDGVGFVECVCLATEISFLLKVCSTFFGVLVGLVPGWLVVGVGMFAVFMV
jgi:hypothetical protein